MREKWKYKEDVKMKGTLSMDEWGLLTKLIYGVEKWEDWKEETEKILESIKTELVITELEE